MLLVHERGFDHYRGRPSRHYQRPAREWHTGSLSDCGPSMPLTEFQRDILLLLAKNRNPDSYVAGGIVLNQAKETPRFSKDIDVFHDVEEEVAAAASADSAILKANGFNVHWIIEEPRGTRFPPCRYFQRPTIS